MIGDVDVQAADTAVEAAVPMPAKGKKKKGPVKGAAKKRGPQPKGEAESVGQTAERIAAAQARAHKTREELLATLQASRPALDLIRSGHLPGAASFDRVDLRPLWSIEELAQLVGCKTLEGFISLMQSMEPRFREKGDSYGVPSVYIEGV